MSANLDRLPAYDPDSGSLNVIIDTPRGSRNKFKYEKHDLFRLSKVLPLGASFPFDFGFVPPTEGEDGDPLDVLVLMDEAAFAGCVVPARLIGVIEAEQTEEGKTMRNDRLVAVLQAPLSEDPRRSLHELDARQLDEIEHFFVSYNQMEGRAFKPLNRRGPETAERLVKQAMKSPSRNGKKSNRQARARK